jgi:hypothetical protein
MRDGDTQRMVFHAELNLQQVSRVLLLHLRLVETSNALAKRYQDLHERSSFMQL